MLSNRWNQLCETAGPDGSVGWTAIATAYDEPHRAYHNLRHVADRLRLLDEYTGLAADPVSVEFAIWFSTPAPAKALEIIQEARKHTPFNWITGRVAAEVIQAELGVENPYVT